ncbi:MAG: galactose mutarotase [Bryobacterales bacterium]|nr:galactose mutarotase [Bryobacterales bacterium]
MFQKLAVAAGLMAALIACAPKKETGSQEWKKQSFGKTASGEEVELYTLANSRGMEAGVITYGAIVTSLKVPDAKGGIVDVALGFDTLEGYILGPDPYFGAIVGRYGNRIAKGRFSLGGVEYKLAVNNGANALHGGLRGFDKQVWKAKPAGQSLELTYVSKDGEEGYPGTLTATVAYTVTEQNELRIEYSALTDKETVLNLTNHTYFNLAGQGEGDILGHIVTINADRFTPVDAGLIPTGELRSVERTAFDFRQPIAIGERVNAAEEQIKLGKGYDHNYVLNGAGGGLAVAATVTEPKSGRTLQVSTTEPGVQFYTGNFLDGTLKGKGGKVYQQRYGFCLETQHFPDSPNRPEFPSAALKPGARFQSTTVFKFSATPGS